MKNADQREPHRKLAAALSVGVHVAFVLVLVFGVSWKNRDASPVSADLWAELPTPNARPVPPAETPPPPPEPKPEPKPEPVKPAPAPKAEPAPKADIALKAKQEEEKRKQEEKKKREDEQKKKDEEKKKQDDKKKQEADKQRELVKQQAAEAKAQAKAQQAAAAAQKKKADAYGERIVNKIRPLIVNLPCEPLGDPEVDFAVTLMPTGELLTDPRLAKSSGSAACDQAVERAILRASPLPAPEPGIDRRMTLRFWPNRKN